MNQSFLRLVELEQQVPEQFSGGEHFPRRNRMLVGGGRHLRSGPHHLQCLGGVPLSESQPGRRRVALDVNLPDPVLVGTRLVDLILQLSQPLYGQLGRFDIAAAGRPEGPRKMCNGFVFGEPVPRNM